MKKKMTFGVAFQLALKETGYKISLCAAVLAVVFAIIYGTKHAWLFAQGEYWPVIGGFAAAFILLMARPANINADPVASGYPEYTNE